MIRMTINGREVRNPVLLRLGAALMILVLFTLLSLLTLVVLPLVGIALGVALALGAAGAGAVAIGVPVLRRLGRRTDVVVREFPRASRRDHDDRMLPPRTPL